jgi:uncharacterized membrane protein YfhO
MKRPAVAALELSRSKLAAWATISFASMVVFGWMVEATVKWAASWVQAAKIVLVMFASVAYDLNARTPSWSAAGPVA